MATNKKIPSQGNLVDMLAAFGRGALGTLTDRFNQYDAALESVAGHEQTLDKHLQVLNSINEAKVEWFVIPITAAVYEDILSGVKDYITIPYDISTLIEGDSQLKSGQAGIKLEVADEASVNAVYLPFTLVSQAYILPSFDDLVIRGTSLSSGNAYDTRYKVDVNVQTGYIVLEKVEESAAAELPWLDVTPQGEEELDKFVAAFIQEAGLNGKADYELNLNASTDLTQYRGIRLDLTEGNVVETPVVATVGNGFICAPAFLSDNEFVFGITKETGGKFILNIYNLSSLYVIALSGDYAKKTDIPEKPFTFVVDGDAAGYDVDGLVSGVASDFDIALSTAVKNQLTQALYKITIAENAAAGTAMSMPDTDIVNLMPRFTLLLGKGNFGYRFYASGTQNESGLIHFKGTISLNAKSTEWVAVCDLGSASRITFKRIM